MSGKNGTIKGSDAQKERATGKPSILPSLGSYSSRREWEDACWRVLSKPGFALEPLLTSYERRNLIMRAAVIDGLASGKTYREIGRELWLSSQTISSIKKTLSGRGYRSYRERGKTERKARVYSSDRTAAPHKRRGRPHRTKYGTLYMPY